MKFEHKIVLAYLILGGLWILFSDKIIVSMFSDPIAITRQQTYKGWLYVGVTGLLFFLFLRHHLEKLRKAEQKAKESDRLKTNFIQNISHEIRTPMNGIIGFTEMLKDRDLTDAEKEEYLKIISESTALLFNLVNEVLDISLIESGTHKLNLSNVSLNKLISEIMLAYKPAIKENINFSGEFGNEDGNDRIVTDELKLRQVFGNLISNSIKFVEKGYIRFGYMIKDSEVEFFVEDSGVGINKEFQEKVFERFFKDTAGKTKLYNGVGLGLPICKGIIELLNGRIWLNSEPGKGTRFNFTIPLIRPEKYSAPVKKTNDTNQPDTASSSVLTILITEDNSANQFYIKEVLSRIGMKVLLSSDGQEAVKHCTQNSEIDLILMDIKMPEMDGYEALKEIRKFRPDMYIIAQTAYALNEKEKALASGFNDFLAKPFKADQLIDVVIAYKNRQQNLCI